MDNKYNEVVERKSTYDNEWCWQYDKRKENLTGDIELSGFSQEYLQTLSISDFDFYLANKESEYKEIKQFICRHEWLGRLSLLSTHFFVARHKGILAGTIIMNIPNAYSKLLGDDTKKYERLISRGACISWSPKNLASALIMFSINYMVKNTQYRLFTAYSDPEARELGTVYQACNFYYLGKLFGSDKKYLNPYTGNYTNDRVFRRVGYYQKFAKEIGLGWNDSWANKTTMLWDNMTKEQEKLLKDRQKEVVKSCVTIDSCKKHKYAYVLGSTKGETKNLRKKFLEINKIFPYPKDRGQ